MLKSIFAVIGTLTFFSLSALAEPVRYELTVAKHPVNLSGRKTVDFSLAVNGGIPAPTLSFTEDDDAEIVVHNRVPGEEVSIHWHGILLPPEEDGVAYVNTPPILSGKSHTFRFKVRQHGTYWYHSHTGIQEQKGVYGAIVIHPKKPTRQYDHDVVAVLSDWSDENPDQILRNLRKDGDYYLFKKDTVRSYFGALKAGGLRNFLFNEWTRMGGMDLSDVGYDAFLINGRRESQLVTARPGERVRVRLINAGASTYFNVSAADAPLTVVAADGIDVEPRPAHSLLIGMAETYDVIFTVPKDKNYELRATAQDGTGYASAWVGVVTGEKRAAVAPAPPDLYGKMAHGNSHADHGVSSAPGGAPAAHSHSHPSSHARHGPAPVDNFGVENLKSPVSTQWSATATIHDFKLVLGGDMVRYVWHINGRVIHEDRTIEIREGDVVRFTFVNETMMHHPFHLHGHFFRVVTTEGPHSPLKHTVDIAPHATRVIEFLANEPGQWMLHCHNLYHMKTGMARVVKYMTWQPRPDMAFIEKSDPHRHDHWYFAGKAEAASNHAEVSLRSSQTWNQLEARLETANIAGRQFSFDDKWDYEGDLFYRRWFGNFFSAVAGGTSFGERIRAVAGFSYRLPFLIETQFLINTDGRPRIDVSRRFQWTKSVFTDIDFMWRPGQTDGAHAAEIEVTLMYRPRWSWAAGLMLTNDSLGAGVEVQF